MFKSNRYLEIVILLAVLILSVSAVSAESTANDGTGVSNGDNSLNNQNYNPTKTWTPQEFLDNANDISDGDVILITAGTGDVSKNITLDKNNVVIYSQSNAILNGANANANFKITGNNILIQGITFTNFSYTGYGGVIYGTGTNTTINNCTFKNNQATNEGGAIYFSSATNAKVDNCLFANNSALSSGAAGFFMSTGSLTNSKFINNTATVNAGAFHLIGTNSFTAAGCTFINNTARGSNGGAVYWAAPNGLLANSTFIGNSASFYGGAVYWGADNGIVKNCTFKNNKVTSPENNYGGGAINWFSANNGTVANSTFVGDTAYNGGAIYWFGSDDGLVTGCTFKDNRATNLGGAINWFSVGSYKSNGDIEYCTFVNSTGKYGEGIYNNGEDFILGLGNGTLVYNEGLIYQVNVTMLDNKTHSVVEDQKVNLTAKVTSNNYTIMDPNFKFVIDGKQIDATFDKDQFVAEYTVPATDKVVVGGVYSKGHYTTYKNGLLAVKELVNVTSSDVTADYGQAITVNTNVKSDNVNVNEGNVYITINNRNYTGNVANGIATINIPAGLNAGEYKVTVFYKENDNYIGANTTVTIRVNPIQADVKLNVSNGTYGQSVVADVNINDVNGTVNVTINNKNYAVNLVNGKGSVAIAGLNAGNYTATVDFKGNSNYIGSKATSDFAVEKAATKVGVDVQDVTYGSTIMANLTLTDSNGNPISGNVKVTVNNKEYDVAVTDGKGKLIVNDLDSGNYTVTANFEGNSNYMSSQANADTELIETGYHLESGDIVKYFENGTNYEVKVTDKNGNPAVNVPVTVSIDGKYFKNLTYTIVSNASGVATLPINLAPGNYNITAVLGNESVTNTIKVLPLSSSLIAEDIDMYYKDGTNYTAKLVDSQGNGVAGKTIAITVDSAKWTNKANYNVVTDANGVAKLPINLAVGNYNVTAKYGNESIVTDLNVLAMPITLEIEDVVKYFKNGTQYEVTVKDIDGNPVVNKNVKVTIKSSTWKSPVTYNIATNGSGVATLIINLAPGQYTATATVDGNIVTSSIRVIPTLTCEDISKSLTSSNSLVAKLVDGQGNPSAGKTLTFTIKAKTYTKVTDANGLATLPINLGSGIWTINVADPETGAKTIAKVSISK